MAYAISDSVITSPSVLEPCTVSRGDLFLLVSSVVGAPADTVVHLPSKWRGSSLLLPQALLSQENLTHCAACRVRHVFTPGHSSCAVCSPPVVRTLSVSSTVSPSHSLVLCCPPQGGATLQPTSPSVVLTQSFVGSSTASYAPSASAAGAAGTSSPAGSVEREDQGSRQLPLQHPPAFPSTSASARASSPPVVRNAVQGPYAPNTPPNDAVSAAGGTQSMSPSATPPYRSGGGISRTRNPPPRPLPSEEDSQHFLSVAFETLFNSVVPFPDVYPSSVAHELARKLVDAHGFRPSNLSHLFSIPVSWVEDELEYCHSGAPPAETADEDGTSGTERDFLTSAVVEIYLDRFASFRSGFNANPGGWSFPPPQGAASLLRTDSYPFDAPTRFAGAGLADLSAAAALGQPSRKRPAGASLPPYPPSAFTRVPARPAGSVARARISQVHQSAGAAEDGNSTDSSGARGREASHRSVFGTILEGKDRKVARYWTPLEHAAFARAASLFRFDKTQRPEPWPLGATLFQFVSPRNDGHNEFVRYLRAAMKAVSAAENPVEEALYRQSKDPAHRYWYANSCSVSFLLLISLTSARVSKAAITQHLQKCCSLCSMWIQDQLRVRNVTARSRPNLHEPPCAPPIGDGWWPDEE